MYFFIVNYCRPSKATKRSQDQRTARSMNNPQTSGTKSKGIKYMKHTHSTKDQTTNNHPTYHTTNKQQTHTPHKPAEYKTETKYFCKLQRAHTALAHEAFSYKHQKTPISPPRRHPPSRVTIPRPGSDETPLSPPPPPNNDFF